MPVCAPVCCPPPPAARERIITTTKVVTCPTFRMNALTDEVLLQARVGRQGPHPFAPAAMAAAAVSQNGIIAGTAVVPRF
jgi:hypothetical protein